jgi:hypothetical protein
MSTFVSGMVIAAVCLWLGRRDGRRVGRELGRLDAEQEWEQHHRELHDEIAGLAGVVLWHRHEGNRIRCHVCATDIERHGAGVMILDGGRTVAYCSDCSPPRPT